MSKELNTLDAMVDVILAYKPPVKSLKKYQKAKALAKDQLNKKREVDSTQHCPKPRG